MTESWTQNNVEYVIVYLYDESGAPIGMQYRTSAYAWGEFDNFFFEKNLFGDIVAIYNEYGVKVLSYSYDAWGNVTQTWHNMMAQNLYANYNPFRYRGYYYDTETGFYYLQSRYYDPVTGRFLNADGYINANGDLIGFNMYAYCSNNPMMYTDPTGESLFAIIAVTAVLIASTILFTSCNSLDANQGDGYKEYIDDQNGPGYSEQICDSFEDAMDAALISVYEGRMEGVEYAAAIYVNSDESQFLVQTYTDGSVNSVHYRADKKGNWDIVAGVHYHPSNTAAHLSNDDLELSKKHNILVVSINKNEEIVAAFNGKMSNRYSTKLKNQIWAYAEEYGQ